MRKPRLAWTGWTEGALTIEDSDIRDQSDDTFPGWCDAGCGCPENIIGARGERGAGCKETSHGFLPMMRMRPLEMALYLALLPALCSAALAAGPYPGNSYDAATARAYFGRQPFRVLSRAAQISPSPALGLDR